MQMTGAEGSGMPEGGVGMSSHTSSSSEEGGGRISSIQVQEYLSGVNYPAIKQDMLDTARSNKAPEEVMYFMNRLPEKTYNSPNDVEESSVKSSNAGCRSVMASCRPGIQKTKNKELW